MELKIPPLPNTLGKILQFMSDKSASGNVDQLVEIIRKDPATSIYVLRRINSPYHGLRRYISEIDQAVVLLGFKRVCNLVLTVALKQSFSYMESTAAQNVYEHIMQTSLATAAFARDLSSHLRFPFTEKAFTAGLLHQLGRLVLLQSASQLYVSLWYQKDQETNQLLFLSPSPEKEEEFFDTNYPTLGAATMRKWSFPEDIVAVTGALLAPQVVSGQKRLLTLTVAAGSAVAEQLFGPQNGDASSTSEAPEIPVPVITLARDRKLDVETLTAFLDERRDAVRGFAETLLDEA